MKMNFNYQVSDNIAVSCEFFNKLDSFGIRNLLYNIVFKDYCDVQSFFNSSEMNIYDVGRIQFSDVNPWKIYICIEKSCPDAIRVALNEFIFTIITFMNEDDWQIDQIYRGVVGMYIDYKYYDLTHSIEFDCKLYEETLYNKIKNILFDVVFKDYLPEDEFYKDCSINDINHLGTYNDFFVVLKNIDGKIEVNISKKSPEDLKNKLKKFISTIVRMAMSDI